MKGLVGHRGLGEALDGCESCAGPQTCFRDRWPGASRDSRLREVDVRCICCRRRVVGSSAANAAVEQLGHGDIARGGLQTLHGLGGQLPHTAVPGQAEDLLNGRITRPL